jgi:hypothetical protein
VRLGCLTEVRPPRRRVAGERLVAGALVHGQLQLSVPRELPAAAVGGAAVADLVFEAALALPAVRPVPQRSRVRAPLRIGARVLARAGTARLVRVGLVAGHVALLEDDPGAVQS